MPESRWCRVLRNIALVLRFFKYGLGGYAAWRLLGDRNRARSRGPQKHPLPIPGRTVFVGNDEFLVREAGLPDAPPIVLIHGWVYDSVFTFSKLAPYFLDRFRVIMIDLRNYGGSSKLNEEFEIETMADEVAAVLDSIGVSRATVFGYSMGGMVTMALARRHPAKVSRMVLAATSASVMRRRVLDPIGMLALRALWHVGRVEGAHISAGILHRAGAFEAEYDRWLWDELLNRDVAMNLRGLRAIKRFDARRWLGTLETPALVVVPTRDQLIPPWQQYELAGLIRDASVHELLDARHEAIFTHAAEIAGAVVKYVE